MNRLSLPPSRRILSAAAVLALGSLALGACGSTASSLSSTASSIAKAAGSGSTGSGSGGSLSSALNALERKTSTANHATFMATYSASNLSSGGTSSTQTITIAQKGTQSAFTTGSGSFYSNGTTDTFCGNSSGSLQCTQSSGTGVNPLASLVDLFNPATVSAEIQAVAAAAGVSVTQSNETHGGLSSQCYSYTKSGQASKACFSSSGILTYASSAGGSFELTSFTTNVSDSDVSIPAGATIVTEPSIP